MIELGNITGLTENRQTLVAYRPMCCVTTNREG